MTHEEWLPRRLRTTATRMRCRLEVPLGRQLRCADRRERRTIAAFERAVVDPACARAWMAAHSADRTSFSSAARWAHASSFVLCLLLLLLVFWSLRLLAPGPMGGLAPRSHEIWAARRCDQPNVDSGQAGRGVAAPRARRAAQHHGSRTQHAATHGPRGTFRAQFVSFRSVPFRSAAATRPRRDRVVRHASSSPPRAPPPRSRSPARPR